MCSGERLFSCGTGCWHGLGAGFGQVSSEASCGCRICLLHRELPGCRMEKYSGARPRFGLGGLSSPPASACGCGTLGTTGLGGSPVGMAGVGYLQPACREGGFGRSRGESGAGGSLPASPASLRWISASDPRLFAGMENPAQDLGCTVSGFAMKMGSRLRSLPAAGLNPRHGLEAVWLSARGYQGKGCGVPRGATGPRERRGTL